MRFKIILLNLSFLFLLPSFGQITIIDTIESGGLERNYRLYIPTAYDGSEPVPLVLNLHGYTSDAFGQDLYANFRVKRGEVLKQNLVLGGFRRFQIDLVHLYQREVALAILGGANFALDGVAGVKVETPDLTGRDIDVVGARQV